MHRVSAKHQSQHPHHPHTRHKEHQHAHTVNSVIDGVILNVAAILIIAGVKLNATIIN